VLPNDRGREGTNFHLNIKLSSGKQIFIETKFTESGFGKAKDNDLYRRRYQEIYQERLSGMLREEVDGNAAFDQLLPIIAKYIIYRIWK
jgi:hypothetical protein